jgi:hypothetical protein
MINYCNGASIPQWRAEMSWGIKPEFNQESELEFSGILKVHLSMNCNGALQASNSTNFCNIYLVCELNETTYCKKENKSCVYLESLETPNHNSYFKSRCAAVAFMEPMNVDLWINQSDYIHRFRENGKAARGICS